MDYPVRADMGGDGKFTDGNPSSAIPASLDAADDQNQVYDELIALVEDAALAPDHATRTQVRDAIRKLASELPLSALQFPTIETADNRIVVTPAAAVDGGTVSIPADVWLSVAEELTAGESGRMRTLQTAAWSSADLDVSSTYYLRANLVAGVLTPYVQKGTDSDTVPASLKGTAGGGTGGGFDSTVLDILIARVVTGLAGTIPTVTELRNKVRLEFDFNEGVNVTGLAANTTQASPVTGTVLNIDWARTPVAIVSARGTGGSSSMAGGVDLMDPSGAAGTLNRYQLQATLQMRNNTSSSFTGTMHYQMTAFA